MDWLLLGLGNPGPEYWQTRHNAGFWLIDRLAQTWALTFKKPFFQNFYAAEWVQPEGRLLLAKPLTYMNRSGAAVWPLLNRLGAQPRQCLVLVDQMDLPPGQWRLKERGGHAGHKGLKSLEEALGTQDFPRLFLGIGRPLEGSVTDHVLGVPGESEMAQHRMTLERLLPGFPRLLSEGLEGFRRQVADDQG